MDVLNTFVVKIIFLNKDLLLKIITKELHQFLLTDIHTQSMFVWAFPVQSFQKWFCLVIFITWYPKTQYTSAKNTTPGKTYAFDFPYVLLHFESVQSSALEGLKPKWVLMQPWAPCFVLSADSTVSIALDRRPQKVPPDLNYPIIPNCFTRFKPKLVHKSLLGFVRVRGIISLNGSDMGPHHQTS